MDSVLETTDHGYLLRVQPTPSTRTGLSPTFGPARRGLAPLASQLGYGDRWGWPTGQTVALVDELDEALAAWRGRPYADLPDHPDVLAERAALERLRVAAEEARLLGLLALGEHASVLSTAESTIAREPLRERLRAIHALALLRSGRQVEALDALRTFRELLAEDTGLDPSPELAHLEQAILRQDPALMVRLEEPAAVSSPATAPRSAPTAPDVGRGAVRQELRAVLDRLAQGSPALATVIGEPGIGKSWLVRHLGDEARANGVCVASGTCSQDDGAPPLWPWLDVLRALEGDTEAGRDAGGVSLADVISAEAGASGPGQVAFQTWDRIARTVLAAARRRPVLVVLDDLHWADEATLRALRHLVSVTPDDVPLAVVATRRRHPEPTGALADVAEVLARRQALRVELTGLDEAEATALVTAVAQGSVARPDQPRRGDSGRAATPSSSSSWPASGRRARVPATVREVVSRRLEGLPGDTLATLRAAAVVGRVLPRRDGRRRPAAGRRGRRGRPRAGPAAGVVADHDAEGYAFTHALTHEAVTAHPVPAPARPAPRAGRPRAGDRPGAAGAGQRRRADRGAGPSLAGQRTDQRRPGLARGGRGGRPGAAGHGIPGGLGSATRGDSEPRAGARGEPEERYRLLLELARDSAYAAWWPTVSEASYAAMALARALDRPDLVGPAAAGLSRYCVWTIHDWMETSEDGVDDLRWALRALPEDDSAERCMLLLSLAVELYYDAGAVAERAALVDAGLDLARRSADPAVLAWASRAAWLSLGARRTREAGSELDEEALAAARQAGDHAAEAVALLALASDALELAGPGAWRNRPERPRPSPSASASRTCSGP